ncbi:uncharacterized protein M421DRAFT_25801, partial [Didymella exigua CBS 183.55]
SRKLEPIVPAIGVSYVGIHLVEAVARHYNVVAYELSTKHLLDGLSIEFTSNASDLSRASHFPIAIPTLLNEDKTIDTA